MTTNRCSIIPLEDLFTLIANQMNDLPVWLETRNGNHAGAHSIIEAAAIQDYGPKNDRVVTPCGSYALVDYGHTWRLWYAFGAELPSQDTPW